MRVPILALILVVLAAWPGQARGLREHAVESLAGVAVPGRPVLNGPDGAKDADGAGAAEGPCAMWSEGCSSPVPAKEFPKAAAAPINPGFRALGAKGKTGTVNGPGKPGNGAYTVDGNAPYEIKLTIKTGRIEAQLTLARDPATGKDTVRRKGRVWKQGKWTAPGDVSYPAHFAYDADGDHGRISWNEGKEAKQEGYWRGASGTSMTIELGGGWDHDFVQD